MGSWDAEGWESEDFVVELQENSDPASSEQPSSKRLDSRTTPERFRCPPAAAAGDRQAGAACNSGGGDGPLALQQQPQQQEAGQLSANSRQNVSTGSGSWSVRSIFMARRPESPPRQALQQLAPVPAHPQQTPTAGPPLWSPGLGTHGRGPADEADEFPGPLTQMAAAHASVASAFCSACGTFLADLGGPQEQAAHSAACQAQHRRPGAVAAGTGAAPSGPEPQQGQQPQQAPGPSFVTTCEDLAEEEEGSEEQDGNWSEQEEASQAAAECGVAAAAVAGEDEEAGDSEDGWGGSGGEAEAAGAAGACSSGEQAALHAWLEARGLDKYAELFARAGEGCQPCRCWLASCLHLPPRSCTCACRREQPPACSARPWKAPRSRPHTLSAATSHCCCRRRPVAAALPHRRRPAGAGHPGPGRPQEAAAGG